MKNILIGLLFISTFANAQETEFKFTKEGFTDFVVESIEGKTNSELFKKTLDWVTVTYKNPKEVIKARIENDYIRIEGSKSNMLCTRSMGASMCNDVRYLIEISFKDGKYKFDLINLNQFMSGSMVKVYIENPSVYYNSKGNLKSSFKEYPKAIETEFNSLNISLKNFLKSDAIPSKKSDW